MRPYGPTSAWADHGIIADNLAGQRPHKMLLTGDEQQQWTAAAQAAQRRTFAGRPGPTGQ
ncbi:hypothetical protein [Streptomyces sp. NBC_01525]|uniref:hypothetical protein n=1 Tax=Streptomyces sp. NBC_01525 TaxID=2903893 RepID=UPI00387058D7